MSTIGRMVVVLVMWAVPLQAQIPEEYENLQVLPEDVSRNELVGIMRGFTGALGVRCQHCHVGEDPSDLSTFDFASDDKPAKDIARDMMRMVEAINTQHVAEAVTVRDQPLEQVRVTCATCHRGLTRPVFIEQVFAETLDEQGLEAAKAEYRQLRERYYGAGVYDFRAQPLQGLARQLAGRGRPEQGVAVLEFTTELEPENHMAWFGLAQFQAQTGQRDAAIENLERAIEVAPEEARGGLRRALQQVRGAGGGA